MYQNDKIKIIKNKFSKNKKKCSKILEKVTLLSNQTRFHLLCALEDGEFCVTELKKIIGDTKISNISIHLKILRLADIIEARKSEKKIYYKIKDQKTSAITKYLQTLF